MRTQETRDRAFSGRSVDRAGRTSGSLQVAVKVRHCVGRRRRSSSGSFQLRGTEGSLSRFYERLAVTLMECVTSLARVVCYVSATKDAAPEPRFETSL